MTDSLKFRRLMTLRQVRDHIGLAGQIFIEVTYGNFGHEVQITKQEARRMLSTIGLDEDIGLTYFGGWDPNTRRLTLG